MIDPAWIQVGIAALVASVGGWKAFQEIGQYKAQGADDRTIELHRDLTTGEIGAARDRFTEYMYQTGQALEPARCYQPTFSDLLDPRYSGEGNGRLAVYPRGMHAPAGVSPMQDLYKVLWTFERVEASRARRRLDDKLTQDLIGYHAVWWNGLLERISESDTMHRKSLNELSKWLLTARTEFSNKLVNQFTAGPLK